MIELSFSDGSKSFECSTCPLSIQKLRRCQEDREDFTHKDGALWPMEVSRGGQTFGFCPGKATWDRDAMSLYRMLCVSFEYKTLPYPGSVSDQPSFIVDLLASFASRYDGAKFSSRAKMILGDSNNGSVKK